MKIKRVAPLFSLRRMLFAAAILFAPLHGATFDAVSLLDAYSLDLKYDDINKNEVQFYELNDDPVDEIAVLAVAAVDCSLNDFERFLKGGDDFRTNSKYLNFKIFDGMGAKRSGFNELGFAADEFDEVERLLNGNDADSFHFRAEERRRFEAVRHVFSQNGDEITDAIRESVNRTMQEILYERYREYAEQGIDGIEPYHRNDGKVIKPGPFLGSAVEDEPGLSRFASSFQQRWRRAPDAERGFTFQRSAWGKQKVNGRPLFTLSHSVMERVESGIIAASREFYVGHSYDSMQMVAYAIPHDGKIQLICINRTLMNEPPVLDMGFVMGIAQDRLGDELKAYIESVKRRLENGS